MLDEGKHNFGENVRALRKTKEQNDKHRGSQEYNYGKNDLY